MSRFVRSGRDTWANSNRPARNYVRGSRLRAKSGENNIYIGLKVPPAAIGKSITTGLLHLTQDGAFTGTNTLTVRRISGGWVARLLNWNNKPGVVGGTATMAKTASADATVWSIDISALVQAIADGADDYGFRVTTDSTTQLKFYSLNAARRKPYLELEWVEVPDAPTNLAPSGGAIGIGLPLLTFDYDDQSGNSALVAVQVQIDAGNDFSSPDFDSGEVATSIPELDLTDTAYAGLADGATTYWRVRAKNADGAWSDWSDVESFSRDNKGTLTIDNPAADPNDFVNEFTPPIMWTLTGETQEAYQVRIYDAARPKTILHDSGVTTSTDDSYTLPKGVLRDGRDYIVLVRVWDTKNRVKGSPTDPVYVQASRTFTVAYDASVDAPATLTADQVTGKPWVDITITRATAPDSWTLMRATDGGTEQVVDTDIDPSDVFTTGTTYVIRDWTAAPERSHVYRVRAEVNGVLSTGGPTDTVAPSISGVWIGDPDDELEVVLGGYGQREVGTYAMGEEAGEFYPLGGEEVVRIVQGMRGLEGGSARNLIIRDRDGGYTWQELEAALLAIKEKPANVYRLVMGDTNIPVVLGGVTIGPHQSTRPGAVRKAVSFEYWQTGELPFEAEL